MKLVGAAAKSLLGQLNNMGTIIHAGTGELLMQQDGIIPSATILNANTYDIQEGTDIYGINTNATFTNDGTLSKSMSNGSFSIILDVFTNTGAVDVQIGALNLSVGGSSTGTFTVDSADARLNFSGGAHTLNAGANFNGVGLAQVTGGTLVISADVSAQNFGVTNGTLLLNPGVTFTVNGDYTQSGNGVLEYDIDSSGSGQLAIGGQAALGGYLRIRFQNSYTPMPDDTFQVLSYGSRSGNFGYDFPSLSGEHLEAAFDPPDDPDVPGSLTIWTVAS
jgi:hypothetical protein